MVVRIDKARIAEHVACVDGLIGGFVEILPDGADDAVFCVEVDVFIHAVFVVARDKACDLFDEKCFHGCIPCRLNIHIYYTGCGGKCKHTKNAASNGCWRCKMYASAGHFFTLKQKSALLLWFSMLK